MIIIISEFQTIHLLLLMSSFLFNSKKHLFSLVKWNIIRTFAHKIKLLNNKTITI